jgi:hypothetical protein
VLFPCINRAELRVDCSESRKEVLMKTSKLAAMIFLSLVLCAGCAKVYTDGRIPAGSYVIKKSPKQGPPLNAPAHGYRYQHEDGVTLEFNARLGVYTVVESPKTYFRDGLFYRIGSTGQCVIAPHLDGPWRLAEEKEVPMQLARANGKNRNRIW